MNGSFKIKLLFCVFVVCIQLIDTSAGIIKNTDCPPSLDDPKNYLDYEAYVDTAVVAQLISNSNNLAFQKCFRLIEGDCDFQVLNIKNSRIELVISKLSKSEVETGVKIVLVKSLTKFHKTCGMMIEFKTKAEILLAQ